MLAIRMQRTGRKGHAQFRVVVQDSRRTPTSGRIVAALGHYNPHTKEAVVDKDKASFYLEHGAQPSPRVVRLLKAQGVKLPEWVKLETKKTGNIKHAEKLRRNQPKQEAAPQASAEEIAEEAPVETEAPVVEEKTEEAPAEEEKTEAVAEEKKEA